MGTYYFRSYGIWTSNLEMSRHNQTYLVSLFESCFCVCFEKFRDLYFLLFRGSEGGLVYRDLPLGKTYYVLGKTKLRFEKIWFDFINHVIFLFQNKIEIFLSERAIAKQCWVIFPENCYTVLTIYFKVGWNPEGGQFLNGVKYSPRI